MGWAARANKARRAANGTAPPIRRGGLDVLVVGPPARRDPRKGALIAEIVKTTATLDELVSVSRAVALVERGMRKKGVK